MAIARDVLAPIRSELVGDMSPSWNRSPFSVNCTSCEFQQTGRSYFELPPVFHSVDLAQDALWAYNWKHLDLVTRFLTGGSTVGHPYAIYETYIHGAWKKEPEAALLAIGAHIAQADASHRYASRYHRSKPVD